MFNSLAKVSDTGFFLMFATSPVHVRYYILRKVYCEPCIEVKSKMNCMYIVYKE